MRLQKFIADCGVASRRGAEKIIQEGRVYVNGELVDFMGCMIEPDTDVVEIDGKVITPEKKKYYIMLNKPKNYVTTVSDEFGRPTVMQLVNDIDARIYPVGRLDFDTTGLLLMTNDGEFANLLTHPRHSVNKTYIARVDSALTEIQLERLCKGIELDGSMTAPAKAERQGGRYVLVSTEREARPSSAAEAVCPNRDSALNGQQESVSVEKSHKK